MIASQDARFALELWAEHHPDTSHVPDPDQLPLDLDAGAKASENPPAQSMTGQTA
jgi:hypothetical protein